jgi:hypothetical protein
MGSVTFNIDKSTLTDDLQNTVDNLPGLAETTIDDVANIFEDYDLRYTPIGATGELYAQTFIDNDGFLNRTIWSPVDQWDYVIMGTRPHDIFGNWWLWWPGALHPVHHVKHPGTIANDFPALAYMDGMGEAETRLDEFTDNIIGD